MDSKINTLLFQELEKEEDEITRRICILAVSEAQEATNRVGITNIAEHVSKVLDTKLNPILKDLNR